MAGRVITMLYVRDVIFKYKSWFFGSNMTLSIRPVCEVVVGKILPTLRGEVAQVLSRDYGIRQKDIADMLGITQASVSLYVNATRGQDRLLMEMFPDIQSMAAKAARGMVKGAEKGNDECHSMVIFCALCKEIQDDDRFDEYLRRLAENKDFTVCGRCTEI